MKNSIYLIDTENVGDRWIEYINKIEKNDRVIIFYTKNHSKQFKEEYFLLRHDRRIRWVECIDGKNALDYQLMGVLSYMVSRHPEARFIIFSNDTDYKAALDFWEERRIKIERIGFLVDKKKNEAVSKEEKQTPVSKENSTKKQNNNTWLHNDIFKEVAMAVPVEESAVWYSVLTAILGQEQGKARYEEFKPYKNKEELSKYLLSTAKDRNIQLLRLTYYYHELDPKVAEEAYSIIKTCGKKKRGDIHEAFQKKFDNRLKGKVTYYKATKLLIKQLQIKN